MDDESSLLGGMDSDPIPEITKAPDEVPADPEDVPIEVKSSTPRNANVDVYAGLDRKYQYINLRNAS